MMAVLCSVSLYGQNVTISQKMEFKADYQYEILPMANDHILVFKDEGFEQSLIGFDQKMTIKWTKKLAFEKKRIGLIGLLPHDDAFNVYYFFREKSDIFIVARKYSEAGDLMTADTLIQEKYLTGIPSYYFANSPNNKSALIFSIDRQDELQAYGIACDSNTIVWNTKVEDRDFNIRQAFRDIIIRDDASAYFLFEADNYWASRKYHRLELVCIGKGEGLLSLELEGSLTYNLKTELSTDQTELLVSGTYTEKANNKCNGLWAFRVDLDNMSVLSENTLDFKQDLPVSPNLERVETKRGIPDLTVRYLVGRKDGGMVLFCESSKEYVRRPSLTTSSAITRRWVDYYFEDVLVFSLNPQGSLDWFEVLHKKQYSQDDNAAYSSFFLFKLPAQMRVVFNDEIRSANTVSEYIVSSRGMEERKSLMSTDQQDLQLQFRDAIQMDNRTILVPGVSANDMVLVKVEYRQN